jgi:hypothetical protein
MIKRYSVQFTEAQKAQYARNQEALRRILRWQGKDKGVTELAQFLELDRRMVMNCLSRLNNDSHENHALVDIVMEKLP